MSDPAQRSDDETPGPIGQSQHTAAPLRVAVLVDLLWSPSAGGHVKCWERIAQAATRRPGDLDLTVHFAGTEPAARELAPHVRYRLHRPVFSTARLPFLSHVPDHTDLAPRHPALARALADCDVIHTTDGFFAFARTAVAVARRRGVPLVNSIHTDTPNYTRVFTARTVQRLFGNGWLARWLLDGVKVPERAERDMRRKLARHQACAAFALVSRPEERQDALAVLPDERIGWMRRGIDRDAFHPAKRDRTWLEAAYGVPRDQVVVLCVGRVNRGKNVLTLTEALRQVRDAGQPVHLFCAGEGEDRPTVLDRLGAAATCPGVVAPETLARIYASADLVAMPSEIEVFANVVMEALASGVPALVAARSGMGRILRPDETGLVITGDGPAPWAAAIAELAANPGRRVAMGRAARHSAETDLPSWDDVLADDLMPVWRRAMAGAVG